MLKLYDGFISTIHNLLCLPLVHNSKHKIEIFTLLYQKIKPVKKKPIFLAFLKSSVGNRVSSYSLLFLNATRNVSQGTSSTTWQSSDVSEHSKYLQIHHNRMSQGTSAGLSISQKRGAAQRPLVNLWTQRQKWRRAGNTLPRLFFCLFYTHCELQGSRQRSGHLAPSSVIAEAVLFAVAVFY